MNDDQQYSPHHARPAAAPWSRPVRYHEQQQGRIGPHGGDGPAGCRAAADAATARRTAAEVSHGRVELAVRAASSAEGDPLLEFLGGNPALRGRLAQAIDDVIAILVGCPQLAPT